MAFFDTAWYAHFGDGSTTGYYAVAQWSTGATIAAGALRRQLAAPAIGSERVFVCIVAGTTHATTEPTWVLTRGAKTTDNTVTWQECSGAAGLNGDLTNTPAYSVVANQAITLGQTIKNNAATYYFICSTAGTTGAAEPAWTLSAGATTSSGTATWTCLGVVGNFGTWAAPHARLASAFVSTWGVNGNDFYVADNSAETSTAAVTLQIGINGFPSRIFSIDHTASLPASAAALKVGATITSSLAGGNAILIGSTNLASAYWYGVIFVASGSFAGQPMSIVTAALTSCQFDNCSFRIGGANAASIMGIGNATGTVDFNNCSLGFGNVGQFAQLSGVTVAWRNTATAILSGSIGGFTYIIPTTIVLRAANANGFSFLAEGVDFSGVGSNTLVQSTQGAGTFTFKNCKMHSGNIMASLSNGQAALVVDLVNSDSGGSIYRNERYGMYGTLLTSTGVVRSGGATDGTTSVSHNIASTTYARPHRPFNAFPLIIWNDVVGAARSLTVYGTVPGGSSQPLPYNDQFWIDVEYMGDASTPIASLVSTGLPTQLTTHSQTAVADGSSWSGSANTPFSLTATFIAQQKGYVTVYPRMGAASYSLNLDPKPVLGLGSLSVWSAADAATFSPPMVISNGGLTVATPVSGGLAACRGTTSYTSGKYYVEIFNVGTSVGTPNVSIALESAGADITTNLGATNYGVALALYAGTMNVSSGFNSSATFTAYSPAANDVFQIAVDLGAGNVWFGLNNVWYNSGNPATGANPMATIVSPVLGAIPLFPSVGVYAPTPSGPWTLQATAANQTFSPPAGFTPWG